MGRRLITPPSEWGALRRFIGVWLALVLTFGGPSAFAATWFVNPNTGLDTNPGIAGSPFRTITHALSVALSGDTISAAAGIYDALSGETFPLHLKDGVAIVGAGPASSTIDGQGAVTGLDNALFENSGTDLGPTTRLSGFSLRNGTTLFDEDIMFFDLGANNMSPQIDNNNFASAIGSADGILVQWNGGAGQFNANIQSNTFDTLTEGIAFASTTNGLAPPLSLAPTISGNTFTNNATGIELSGTEAVLSGSESASLTPTISGNSFTGGTDGIAIELSVSSQEESSHVEVSPTISNNTFSGVAGDSIRLTLAGDSLSSSATQRVAPQIRNNPSMTGGDSAVFMRILLGAFGDSQVTISPTISGNTISNMTSEGISLLVAAAASSSAQMTIQPSITGNSLATVGDVAIGVPASLLGRGNVNVDFSPTISNNTISEANNGGIALTWALRGGTSSIPFSTRTPRTAQGLEATLRPKPTQAPGGTLTSNALIDGNKVQPPGPSGNGSANGPGIDLFYPDLSDWQNLNVDWTISNNTIRTVHRDGIAVSNSSASSSSISSASASRRPITASAIAANAISKSDAFNSDSGSFNLTIAGNTVSDAGDSGVVVSLFETSLSSVQQSMLINNNSISGAAAAGILISISGSTMSSDLIDVNQNTVTANQTGMAVFQGSLAPGGVNPMLLRCNTITGNSGDGIAVTSTNSQLPDFGGGNLASPGNNQIFGNGDHVTTFDFNNGSAVTAQAQNNYWGSATGPVPATQISGPVNFTPFLTGPPTACAVVTPPATHFGVTAPASATAGSPFTITVTALDASNNPVPTYTGTVHFTSSDPLAALPPNSSLTAGSGTFTVTLATPGTQSITATDTVTSSITGTSNLIAVSAGPATHYSVVAPAGASPGTPFTFTVTALDAFNNVATGYTGTVHFTSTDASATLPANSTLSSGVGSFTATLITPPSQTITATDTSNPSITGTSNSIALSAAVADVAITKVGPPSAIPGSDVTFTITVKNNGPSVASNVVVSDPTPARLTFVSLTGPCSGFPCTIGSMNSGQIVTLFAKYSVQPGPTATVANTATVTTTASDPNPSNNSATARFVTGCPTAAPTLLGPANGTSGVAVNGTLSWTNVDAAVYTVYLDVQGPNACSKFFASTTATSVQFAGLQPGTTYQWRVVASAAGCADKSSQCQTFTTASACPTTGPVLIAPLGGTVEDSVTYSWTAVLGARDYQLFVNDQPVGTTTSTSFGPTKVENGPISWSVVAEFDPPCAPLSSAPVTFNGCDTGATTIPSIYGQLDSAYAYDLTWDPIVGASRYEVDEADNPTFTNATTQTTTGTALQFQHPVTTPTAFYYRVRGFIDCANAFGHNSVVVRIVLAPITSPGNPNVSIPAGSDKLVSIIVHIAGIPNGTFPFTASLDPQQPWLVSVTPASGTLPPEGLDLTVLADPTALANGTHTGTVHVIVTTPSSGPIVANGVTPVGVPVSVSLVSPITPKPGGMPPPNSLIIPSTGHLDGVNSQWASDIRVLNTASQTVHYQLTFTPDDPSQSVRQTVIQVNAGATMALDDVVKTWYGIGSLGESSNGALEIRPLDNPSKGTPDDTTPSVSFTTVASSRTYNAATTSNTASFGEFIPATPFANFVGKALDTSHPATVLGLQQIAQNDAMRTNLGVMEASGQPAQILISVFDSAGNKLLDTPMNLAAFQHAQLNGFLAQNHITLPDGRIEVQVTGGDGKITAYASVIDNKSGDPILVSGVPLGQSSFDNFVLPGVADLNTGLAAWRTDMRIFNPTATPQNTTLTFYPASGDPQSTSITVNPGEVKQLDNTLSSVFGATNTGGTIHVTTAAPAPLVVSGRTYDLTDNGTYGQLTTAVTSADAIGQGDQPLQILQAEDSVRQRTNLGIFEVTGKPATVQVTLFLPDSKVSPSTQIPLPANGFIQIPVIQSFGLSDVYNARVSLKVVGGDGRIGAYGSVIDQLTQDPTLIPAQK